MEENGRRTNEAASTLRVTSLNSSSESATMLFHIIIINSYKNKGKVTPHPKEEDNTRMTGRGRSDSWMRV
jgi:hypothetical protein